jgi:hypothetical protein
MPGCVKVGGVVGRELDPLDGPAFAVRQILLAQAGEELDDVGRSAATSFSNGTEMSINVRGM